MSKERRYSMQVYGMFTIRSKELLAGEIEDIELIVQKEIDKALRAINSKFKCEIAVDEISHCINFGHKKEEE